MSVLTDLFSIVTNLFFVLQTDLETRLESFKDYDREQQRMDFEDYGFTNKAQNPFKRNIYEDGSDPNEDRNQDDTMVCLHVECDCSLSNIFLCRET